MSVVLHLLGEPRIERDGEVCKPPRGHKAWALLAYLILAERPPSRRKVAEMLFSEANDPLAALRWTLSEMRRSAGWSTEVLGGDPLTLALPEGHSIDLLDLARSSNPHVDSETNSELLGSMEFDAMPAFDYWLNTQRRHVATRKQTQLRDDVLMDLASGRFGDAVRKSRSLVEFDPLECRNQEALLRSLAAAGKADEARRQLARCEDLFARELDAPLPQTLIQAAAEPPSPRRSIQTVTANAEARARLQAGRAALVAGAIERGLDRLNGAVVLAAEMGDLDLHAEALLELGEGLAHSAQDRTTEVTSILHRAIAAAHAADRDDLASRAYSELAFVHITSGDGAEANFWLAHAEEHSADDDHLLSVINGLRGTALADDAQYDRSLELFETSIAQATSAGKPRQAAWSHAMASRTHLVRGEDASALHHVEESLEIARSEHWAALLPWPQAHRGELLRRQGDLEGARVQLETAYALASEVSDICWESLAARLLAAVARDQGQIEAAEAWTERSLNRSVPYVWLQAYALEGKCEMAANSNPGAARATAQHLAACAAQNGLREYSVRAAIRLGALGDDQAGLAAKELSRDIDNPVLQDAADAGTPI